MMVAQIFAKPLFNSLLAAIYASRWQVIIGLTSDTKWRWSRWFFFNLAKHLGKVNIAILPSKNQLCRNRLGLSAPTDHEATWATQNDSPTLFKNEKNRVMNSRFSSHLCPIPIPKHFQSIITSFWKFFRPLFPHFSQFFFCEKLKSELLSLMANSFISQSSSQDKKVTRWRSCDLQPRAEMSQK